MQCKGTTKKGQRCRIQGADYCRYHEAQAQPKAQPRGQAHAPQAAGMAAHRTYTVKVPGAWPEKSPQRSLNGYLYVYTLQVPQEAQFFDKKSNKYRTLKTSLWSRLMGRGQMLVKVGYTTHTPLERMAQWEAQCSHRLKPVEPRRARHARHYDHERFGWQTKTAHHDEKKVHEILRREFGTGKVHCRGCATPEKLGVHVEWFLLPSKRSLKYVCQVIESCLTL